MKDIKCINCGNKNDYLVGDPIFFNDEQYLCCHCASLVKKALVQAQKANDEKEFEKIRKQILNIADESFTPATVKIIKKYLMDLQDKKWGIKAKDFVPKETNETSDVKGNAVAGILRIIGILEIIFGIGVGVYYIADLGSMSVSIGIIIGVGSFIGGMLFVGFAEIISLLQKIADRVK